MQKFFEVQAMCGHVGKTKYIPISFPIIAANGKAAAARVRAYARVKHHHKKAILNVWEISFERFMEIRRNNDGDPYLHCENIQQQRQIKNIESRICSIPVFDNIRRRRTKEFLEYKQRINHLRDLDQKHQIMEYYLSDLTVDLTSELLNFDDLA